MNDKESRLDLLVTTNNSEKVNVEIQFTNKYNMVKRSIYYWSGLYREPLQKSMAYKELNPVIAINIMNFNLFKQTELFHTTYHLYEDEEKFKLTDVMEFHFLEIPKLIRAWKESKLDPWNDELTKWLLMIAMVDSRNKKVYEDIYMELEEIAMKDESLHNALKNWEELSMTHEQYLAYEARLKRITDEEAAQREMELKIQEAEVKAKEARDKGREEGKAAGKIEGEKNTKNEIAYQLLRLGLDVKVIVASIGLPEEKILEMKKDMKK